tara:strand:+ start:5758 stop:6234 length:477 start_codon:yes stop_codon:yes gene_type:complete
MKEGVDKKAELGKWGWIIIIAVILVSLYFIWNWFFAYAGCDSWVCFNDRLESCSKTEFIGGDEMIFEYIIQGKKRDLCEIDVELLQGNLNNQDSLKLEGHKMECMLPYGAVIIPESDIGNCHGLLKEGLQDLIIRDLHATIVQNLGRINLEVLPAPEE